MSKDADFRYGIRVLSLILPTYNEAENLPELLPRILSALSGLPHEVIIVDDDSPDRTWEVARKFAGNHPEVHVVRRIGRHGLSSAVIEGFLSAKGDVLVVMDADGQHDAKLLQKLYAAVMQEEAGIAIGSRYVAGGNVGQFDERRHTLSRIATGLAQLLCRVKVKDPMSGFFAIDRELFEHVLHKLNPKGFKILLDLLVHIPTNTPVVEVPLIFGERLHGKSKLSTRVQIEFIEYLYDVTLGKYIPLTFVKYCIVGSLGVGVHLLAYVTFSSFISGSVPPTLGGFSLAVIGAVETAIIFNFFLNNIWTFARERLRGMSAVKGFFTFNAACLFGALANLAVATFLYASGWREIPAVIIGAFTGAVWNYTMNRMLTWKG